MAQTHTQSDANPKTQATGHDAPHTTGRAEHSHRNGDDNDKETRRNPDFDNANRSDNLRDSPTMARLMDALEHKTDIGHYGQFTFVAVARHFLSEDEIVDLLDKQPGMDETHARALYLQIKEHDYNPPKREKILEQQAHQEFQIIPDSDDPDMGNVYRELRFPDGLYENINHYYEDKAESETNESR